MITVMDPVPAPTSNDEEIRPRLVYRAWHHKWSREKDDDLGHGINGMVGVRSYCVSNSGKLWLELLGWGTSQPAENGWILMQFTGLHDKSKRMIYEGDIVLHRSTRNHTYEVKWSKKLMGFVLVGQHEGGEVNWRDGKWFANVAKHLEVIGHIHLQPGLLKP